MSNPLRLADLLRVKKMLDEAPADEESRIVWDGERFHGKGPFFEREDPIAEILADED